MHVLFPIFGGEHLNINKKYVHLIPIEHQSYEIKIQSFFDSSVYNYNNFGGEYNPKNMTLYTLIEEPEKNIKINEYEIQSPLFLFG